MRSRRSFLKLAGVSLVGLTVSGCLDSNMAGAQKSEKSRPNIVFILADDLGNTDLGFTGSDLYRTPNIDRLARQSMYFSNAYSSHPTCSPSRAAILTGKYPARLGIVSHGAPGTVVEGDGNFAQAREYTVAEALKADGYTTCHIGKWHTGKDGSAGPREQGFEYDIASNQFCCPGSFIYPYKDKKADPKRRLLSDVPDLEDCGPDDHLTECLGDEAVKFIGEHKDKPFFLNLWYYAVHTPIECEQDKYARYKKLITKKNKHRNARYAGLVEHLDDSVGKVLQAIEDNGIGDNTIVIFFSDNGGANYSGITSNYPLREGKVTQYLGGVRVPMIVRWPGVTKAEQVCNEPVIGHDFYPTILKMTGAKGNKKQNAEMDGLDITGLLKNPSARLDREALHWLRYPVVFHYRKDARVKGPCGTIIKGDWKMMEFFKTPHGLEHDFELYNIKEDISEKNNLADKMPEKVKELEKDMKNWRKEVGAPSYEMAYREYQKLKNPK